MPRSGILLTRKYRRYRKNLSQIPRTNASEISSRGIELTDADLAMVIGGTQQTINERAMFFHDKRNMHSLSNSHGN